MIHLFTFAHRARLIRTQKTEASQAESLEVLQLIEATNSEKVFYTVAFDTIE